MEKTKNIKASEEKPRKKGHGFINFLELNFSSGSPGEEPVNLKLSCDSICYRAVIRGKNWGDDYWYYATLSEACGDLVEYFVKHRLAAKERKTLQEILDVVNGAKREIYDKFRAVFNLEMPSNCREFNLPPTLKEKSLCKKTKK